MKTQNTQLKPAGPCIASTSAGLLIRSNTYRAALLALFFAGATLLSTSAASADTITVINTNDSGPGSLRQALADANYGDTINFDSSLKGQTITLTTGGLSVDKDVTISGPGAKNLAVDGNAQSIVFYINPGKTVTIDGLTVANGFFDLGGGGIRNEDATLTVSNCTISGNSAAGGGGILNAAFQSDATLTVSNCTISGNSAFYDPGGGIANLAAAVGATATMTITNSTISGNSATTPGGGISNEDATLTVSNCTISGNSAADGGGIFNEDFLGGSTVSITNSTLSGNSAYDGGGIFSDAYQGDATVTITNSTLSGNSATNNGGGISSLAGSAYSSGDSIVTVSNSTISGNLAYQGGGIYNEAYQGGAAVETGDTIFDAGSSGENIFNYAGTVVSHGYNLSSDNGGGYLIGLGDQINTDPLLGPLQDNGGPTFTHGLLPGSPAIDAGDPNFTPPPDYDQRGPGFYRTVNGRIDVGSFEVHGPRPTPTPRPSPTPRYRPTPFPRR